MKQIFHAKPAIGSFAAFLLCCSWIAAMSGGAAAAAVPLTVGQARALPSRELARKLLGEALASRVIEALRHEYQNSDPTVPDYVEFYTQPELTDPRINRICRTDVITIEYDHVDPPSDMNSQPGPIPSSTPLWIAHVEAIPRYKSFPMPPGEPGSDENERAQAEACARMTTALDAFRAPSAGDAQWLDAIEREYRDPQEDFPFTCSFPGHSCAEARPQLQHLTLNLASEIKAVDCPHHEKGDWLDLCYRLTFPTAGERCSDRQDLREFDCPGAEWVLNISAGIKEGNSPVRIKSLRLEHLPPPFSISNSKPSRLPA